MGFPTNMKELKEAGYKFDGEGTCRDCGEELEWWETPRGKKIPMTPMMAATDIAEPHWKVCSERKDR